MIGPLAAFGRSKGPLAFFPPGWRVFGGFGLCVAAAVLPITGWTTAVLLAGVVALHAFLAGMPLRRFLGLLLFSLFAYAPLAIAFSVTHLIRGVAVVFLSANTLLSVTFAEFHGVARSLPVPILFKLLLVQILQQTALLWEQTGEIVRAIQLRAAGPRMRVVLLRVLPLVWVPRLVRRSERVAEAMELRGYIDGLGVNGRNE